MAVEIVTDPVFKAGEPRRLFDVNSLSVGGSPGYRYDVAPDGRKFLFRVSGADTLHAPVTFVANWPSALKK
jgi:hypothetical protein